MYENEIAKAFWDVPVYAESVMVKANRIDARIVEKERKRVAVIEISCSWMDNRAINDAEKSAKYGPLRWELKQQYPGYEVKQFNIIIDVLRGWSVDVGMWTKNSNITNFKMMNTTRKGLKRPSK